MRESWARWLAWIPAAAVAATITYLSHQPSLPDLPGGPPDWLLHGTAYGILALSVAFGATTGFRRLPESPARSIGFAAAAIAFGVVDELHQAQHPPRDPSLVDLVADAAGALVVAAFLALWWSSDGKG